MAMSASSRPTTGHLQLMGRVAITGNIRAVTGLRIGSSDKNIGIGEAAQVLRDALTKRPYIPGSSLRGKLRSLAERSRWSTLSASTQQIGPRVQIHRCTSGDAYTTCAICPVFGVTSDNAFATPTRQADSPAGAEPEQATSPPISTITPATLGAARRAAASAASTI